MAANSLVLPKASCKKCAEITRDVETFCLRHMWWPFRTCIGAPSRGKQPITQFTLRVVDRLNKDAVSLESKSASDYPMFYYALLLNIPGILRFAKESENKPYQFFALHAKEELAAALSGSPEDSLISVGPMDDKIFVRLLWKIAHGFAVAELGWGAANWFLPLLIRDFNLPALHFIGGFPALPSKTENMHELRLDVVRLGSINYVVVGVRLFSFMPTPQYLIVAGSLKSSFASDTDVKARDFDVGLKPPVPNWDLKQSDGDIWRTWR